MAAPAITAAAARQPIGRVGGVGKEGFCMPASLGRGPARHKRLRTHLDIAVAAEIAQESTDPDDRAFWEGFSEGPRPTRPILDRRRVPGSRSTG